MSKPYHPGARRRALSAGAFIGAMMFAGAALALECPASQPDNPIGVDPAAAKVAAMIGSSTDDALTNNMPTLVGLLRSSMPSLQPAQIVNHLIAAYCPLLQARPNLPEVEKKALMESFAAAAAKAAF
jgi:hypothetical protein